MSLMGWVIQVQFCMHCFLPCAFELCLLAAMARPPTLDGGLRLKWCSRSPLLFKRTCALLKFEKWQSKAVFLASPSKNANM